MGYCGTYGAAALPETEAAAPLKIRSRHLWGKEEIYSCPFEVLANGPFQRLTTKEATNVAPMPFVDTYPHRLSLIWLGLHFEPQNGGVFRPLLQGHSFRDGWALSAAGKG